MRAARGFGVLVGKTITKIDTSAMNVVILEDSEGEVYELEAEPWHLGIPVISLKRPKEEEQS